MWKAAIISFTQLISFPFSEVSFRPKTQSLPISRVLSPRFQLYHQPLIISLLCAISFQNICNSMAGWFTREVSNRSGAWKRMNGFGSNGSPCETVQKWKRDQNGFTTLNKSAVKKKKRLILDLMKVCSLHCFHSFVTCVRRCFYYYFFYFSEARWELIVQTLH